MNKSKGHVLLLVLGGSRSGKSSWALRYAEEKYRPCIFIATAEVMDEEMAEVALVVREDFQGQGIGSQLMKILQVIARDNGYKAFMATVLKENIAMTHVFKKLYPHAKIQEGKSGEISFEMTFGP